MEALNAYVCFHCGDQLVLHFVDAVKQLVYLVVYLIKLFLCGIRLSAYEQIKNSAECRCKELAQLCAFLKHLENSFRCNVLDCQQLSVHLNI